MRETKSHLSVALLAACFYGWLLLGALGCAGVEVVSNVPLPAYEIGQPLPTDPPEVGQLLGVWNGNWGGLDSILVVTEIKVTEKRAKVIYAWGDNPSWNTTKGYQQVIASFVSGAEPTIRWGRTIQFEFILKKGKLVGSRQTGGSSTWVTMTKKP